MLVVERKLSRSITTGPRFGNAPMIGISASSIASRMLVPASLVLCFLAGSHPVVQQLMPMYTPGQFCGNGTDGGVACFSTAGLNRWISADL
jgi:hypothetical protein